MGVGREGLGWQQTGHQAKRDRKYSGRSDIVSYHHYLGGGHPRGSGAHYSEDIPVCAHVSITTLGTREQQAHRVQSLAVHQPISATGREPAFLLPSGICSPPANRGKPSTCADGGRAVKNRPEQLYPDDVRFLLSEQPQAGEFCSQSRCPPTSPYPAAG